MLMIAARKLPGMIVKASFVKAFTSLDWWMARRDSMAFAELTKSCLTDWYSTRR